MHWTGRERSGYFQSSRALWATAALAASTRQAWSRSRSPLRPVSKQSGACVTPSPQPAPTSALRFPRRRGRSMSPGTTPKAPRESGPSASERAWTASPRGRRIRFSGARSAPPRPRPAASAGRRRILKATRPTARSRKAAGARPRASRRRSGSSSSRHLTARTAGRRRKTRSRRKAGVTGPRRPRTWTSRVSGRRASVTASRPPTSGISDGGAASARGVLDLAVVVRELGPDECGDEAVEVATLGEAGERLGVATEVEAARRLEGPAICIRPHLIPARLDLAEEDVDAGVADPLELLQELPLALWVVLRLFAKLAKVAVPAIEHRLGHVPQHRGGALLVARVAGVVQRRHPLSPGRVRHLARRPPAATLQVAGRLRGDRRVDPGAVEDRRAQQLEEVRGRLLADVDPELLGVGLSVPVEQRRDDLLLGRHRYPRVWSSSRRTSSSVTCSKFSYQAPTARKGWGVRAQTTSSASCTSALHASGDAVGTQATIAPAPCARSAAIAARIVEPVARPSSTSTTVRPSTSGGGAPSRSSSSCRSSSRCSSAATVAICSSESAAARTRSSLIIRMSPEAIAPMASSSCPGKPSLRT